ncbi:hypothetical protein QYM36_000183 [Artemia franciscana]|uniref:Reverse transcriptase domain-containing protein n=1 Tax=Artemia franciscana TaxID=6661 RepID=A0AA88LG57_ARTSF|nr:hypothetical protein QYM36_000183 [Artemia franciscana]
MATDNNKEDNPESSWPRNDRPLDKGVIGFADDIILLSYLREKLQYKIKELLKEGEQIGLSKSTPKTKIMCNNVNKLSAEPLTDKAKETEEVEMFRYLGSLVSTGRSPEYEVTTHIACTGSIFDNCDAAGRAEFADDLVILDTAKNLDQSANKINK